MQANARMVAVTINVRHIAGILLFIGVLNYITGPNPHKTSLTAINQQTPVTLIKIFNNSLE